MRDHTKLKSTTFGAVSCNGVAIDQIPQKKIAELPVEMMHTNRRGDPTRPF